MRIIAITNLYPNPYQPQRATHNRQHFRALARDHELRIVAPISWVDELRGRLDGKGRLPRSRRCEVDGMEVVHPRYYYPPGVLRSRYGQFFLRSIRSYVRDMAREALPDILLGSWAYPDGYAAVRLAREMNIPAAVHVLGSDVNLLDHYPARRAETWKTLRAADSVITVSQDLANIVIDGGIESQRVAVVYRGIDRSIFFPASQQDAQTALNVDGEGPLLLFVGNLAPVKAVDVLVSACALLADRYPRMQCHIIGDGPLRKQLRAQAIALSVHKQIQFHGVIEHGQLPTWYRAADLVVLPSRAEGVPNVLLESIACGRPYVASDTGGIPEISNHPGCGLVAPGDAQALADAIVRKLQSADAPAPSDLPVDSWAQSGQALANVLANCRRAA